MQVICSSTIASICVHVCPHYRKVKRVDVVYHHIFSLVRRVCVEYPSYVLSQHDAPRPHPNVPALSAYQILYERILPEVAHFESFSAEKKNEEFFSFSSNKEPPVLFLYLVSILSSKSHIPGAYISVLS
jgi:hypothetical protein